MVGLVLRHPPRQQPQYPARINWANPLTAGIAFAYLPGLRADLTKKSSYIGTISGAGSQAQGASLLGTGLVAFSGLTVGTAPLLGLLSNSTIVGVASTRAQSTGNNTLADGNLSQSGDAIYCERAAAGNDIYKLDVCDNLGPTPEFTYRNDGGTLLQQRVFFPSANDGNPHFYAGIKSGTDHTIYCDGTYATSTFGSSDTSFTDAGLTRIIGGDTGDNSASWNGRIDLVIGYTRSLSIMELNRLRENPWQIFLPPPAKLLLGFSVGVTATVQVLKPASTISSGTWVPSTGTTLYGTINEINFNDADYDSTPGPSTFETKLDAGANPGTTSGYSVKYRAFGSGTLTVSLVQGTTIIASQSQAMGAAYATYTLTLTSGQIAAITDWTDLRLRFTSTL